MANRIILPPNNACIDNEPVIFLIGPIAAAGGWQNKAIDIIRSKNPFVYIAVPDYDSVLYEQTRDWSEKRGVLFESQLEWEQFYLEHSEKRGAIAMWMPKQVVEMSISSETGFPRTYARDTRPETGGWGWGSLRHNSNLHVAVGGETGFDGLSVVRRNFKKYAPHIPFRDNLEDVCYDALKFL